MRTFFAKAVLLCCLCITLNLGIAFLPPPDRSGYLAALSDKHLLLEQTVSPKVILVGGSNLAFSVDSSLLERSLGLPVVNMGLHVGLGLRFNLEEIKPYLHASDIVVIVPEYQQFLDMFDGRAMELAPALETYPTGIRYLRSPRQYLNLVLGIGQLQESRLGLTRLGRSAVDDSIYARTSFNDHGDVVAHLDLGSRYYEKTNSMIFSDPIPPFDEQAIKTINAFTDEALRRSVQVFLAYPGLAGPAWERNRATIEAIQKHMEQELQVPILGSPSQFVFAPRYFYDTDYHMTREGRELRTAALASLLRAALGDRPDLLGTPVVGAAQVGVTE